MNEQRRGNAGERPHRNGSNGAAQLQWHIPPRCQGQIIEVSYASDGEHIYRRAIDLGGRTGRVERTPYPACGELGETPFTFEPWNEPPELEGAEWEPVELESDGAMWQPGGFERLDLADYGAMAFDGGGFARLADGAWVRLGSTPERLDAPPIAFAGDWPGARATLATVELGCECGCACDGAALDLRRGEWLCADCAAGEHAPCPHCGQRAEMRTCERCERSAWVVDCGHYAQPRPIAADERGRALCEVCAAPPRRWQAWWYAPDDGQAVALDGGTYECATAAEAQALSEAEARRAVAERQLRIMPTVRVEALERCGR